MSNQNHTYSIQVLDRAFRTLELVAEKGPLSLKELYTTLKINKATMLKIASVMCGNGYLTRDSKSGDYSISFKTFEVGVQAVRNISYINLVKSLLEQLSAELDVIAQFSIEDNDELLCIECFNKNNENFSIYTSVGQRTPLYATSAGKAILSTYSNDEIREKWTRMNVRSITPHTITDYDTFMQEITQIRQQCYATDKQESELGVYCVGTVLLNYNRRPIGAISLSVNDLDEEKERELSKSVIDRTQRLSYMMGYTTP